ncbi:MAG: helix-turn-helix domain-containing protein [Ruminococcaceae bacterium]|nr:helix-turn-helix domain-containing protein [Oscillospiraceae bacterium]
MRMNCCEATGIRIDTARFVPANVFFKNSGVTAERTVECYELVLFLKPGGAAVINGKKYPIAAGSVRFHRPGDRVYSYRFNEIYVLHFRVEDEQRGKALFGGFPAFVTLPDFAEEAQLFRTLIAALVERDDFTCICSLWKLLGSIREQYREQKENQEQKTTGQIKKYIEDHFAARLTLDVLAGEFHLHPVYLQRKFEAEMGLTPTEYQRRVRLSKAKAYLASTDMTIDAIAELCGFANASHFISVFKRSEQLTPLQYRRENNLLV